MHTRRRLTALTLALAAAATLAAGCEGTPSATAPAASTASTASAAPAASTASSAPTASTATSVTIESVCQAIDDVYAPERVILTSTWGQYVTATNQGDTTRAAELKAKLEEMVPRLSKAARAEVAKSPDAGQRAALEQYLDAVDMWYTKPSSGDAVTRLEKAVEAAQKYCPKIR
ncbi:hypothetical protein ABT369_09485 [Dactylosporangium sp. NPDC000244]|uniref:hypothetical protein n=1 Tax=Dactylosporangium sp. NPDC000244 TaxID=3154365 RepID=UPI003333F65E